jgi:hypothetical protein
MALFSRNNYLQTKLLYKYGTSNVFQKPKESQQGGGEPTIAVMLDN